MRRSLILIFIVSIVTTEFSKADIISRSKSAVEFRFFPESGQYEEQQDQQFSIYIEPELIFDWGNRDASVIFHPFFRLDDTDDERSHADLRELLFRRFYSDIELRIGVGKVFWGVTESQHLVDIINQTDFVERIDGEAKLGQAMLHLSWLSPYGTIQAFVLPGFRERNYPSSQGRLRPPLTVSKDADYESSEGQQHIDTALRWSNSFSVWDVGLAVFSGTDRNPLLLPAEENGESILLPYYQLITQYSIDAQATIGSTLIKHESIHRVADEKFNASTTGFEYTFTNIINRSGDLGILLEYQHNSTDNAAAYSGQNDLFLGARTTLNNTLGTEFLVGGLFDLDDNSYSASLEFSSRINNTWKWRIDGWLFNSEQNSNLLYNLRKDDFIQFGLEFYF